MARGSLAWVLWRSGRGRCHAPSAGGVGAGLPTERPLAQRAAREGCRWCLRCVVAKTTKEPLFVAVSKKRRTMTRVA